MNAPRFEDQDLPPNWAELEQRLLQARPLAPRPGFARRWLAKQRANQAAEVQAARQRTGWLLLATGGATLLCFVILLPELRALWGQPGSWLAALAEYAGKLAAATLATLNLLASLAAKLPTAAWVVVSTTGMAAMLLAAVLFSNVSWNKGELK